MKGLTLKETYSQLENEVMNTLKDLINNCETESKFASIKAINIEGISSYVEVALIDDKLVFIDSYGNYYDVLSGYNTLENIITIIINIEPLDVVANHKNKN